MWSKFEMRLLRLSRKYLPIMSSVILGKEDQIAEIIRLYGEFRESEQGVPCVR